nr:HAMP domain-containing methyl-accepting chemotaxis protein [uncultured Cellulosilyticum sp.]
MKKHSLKSKISFITAISVFINFCIFTAINLFTLLPSLSKILNNTSIDNVQKSHDISILIGLHNLGNMLFNILAVSICLSIICTRFFKPFKSLIAACHRMEKGDFSTSIEEEVLNTNDELGQVAIALAHMQDKLNEFLAATAHESKRILSISDTLTQNATKTQEATTNIANAIQEIVSGAEEQTSFTEETAQMTTEIHTGMERVTTNIQEVTNAASLTLNSAHAGDNLIESVVAQMNDINDKVTSTAELVSLLGEKSNEIKNAVSLITDLAKQTNLLALNASIEAARAGDQGKGFAVVADQVRVLAEQSASSATHITNITNEINSTIQNAIVSMSQGTSSVHEGLSLVQNAGTSFKEILTNIQQVSVEIEEVSAITEEVNAGTTSVLDAIENIATISSSASNNTQSVAMSTDAQANLMNEVTKTAADLERRAKKLTVEVSKYTIK